MFARLESAGIAYVVLRGYLPLDELAESLDIDVFVAHRDRGRAGTVLAHAGWLERRHQTGRYPHRFHDNFEVPGRVCTMLDVVYGLCYGDRLHTLRRAEHVLAAPARLDGIRVPPPWTALLTFALHVTLDKGALSDANARRARLMWEACGREPGGAVELGRDFGAAARTFAERFGREAGGRAPADVAALRREALALDCLRPRPVLARVHELRARLRRRTMRPLRVAVLGMDGSGKTTLIEHARSLPSPLPIGSAYLGHNLYVTRVFRWVLDRLAALAASGRSQSLQLRLLDKARELCWPFELYARMRRAEGGRAVVLYDRYPFPRYERDEGPTTLPGHVMAVWERVWTALLPRPQVLLFLDGAPEVIWARKREYPFEVFEAARARMLRLVEEFPGERRVVRTDGPLEQSKDAVTEMLRTSPALRRRLYRATRLAEPALP